MRDDELRCREHPEGGLKHEFRYCYCALKDTEKRVAKEIFQDLKKADSFMYYIEKNGRSYMKKDPIGAYTHIADIAQIFKSKYLTDGGCE